MVNITTINPGVDTGFSTKLNDNFSALNTGLVNTSTGHDHDGTDSSLLSPLAMDKILVGIPQNAFQIVQATTFINQDNLAADILTDSDGKNNTINTGSSTSPFYYYDYDNTAKVYSLTGSGAWSLSGTTYDPQSVSNPSNFFDGDSGTCASKSGTSPTGSPGDSAYLGKTFANLTLVKSIYTKVSASISADSTNRFSTAKIYITVDGATWTLFKTLAYSTGSIGTIEAVTNINQSIKGVAIFLQANGNYSYVSSNISFYELKTIFDTPKTVVTEDIFTLDGTEKGLVVYGNKDTSISGTSINYDVTDGVDTLSANELDKVIDISSLSSGNLSLTYNLITTDTSATPLLFGYGAYIIK